MSMSKGRVFATVALGAVGALLSVTIGFAATASDTGGGGQQQGEPVGKKLVEGSDCLSCHAIDHKVVGPAYTAVAKRYAGQDVVQQLVRKVQQGGAGNWGNIPMSPHPKLSDEKAAKMVKWILSLNESGKAGQQQAAAKPPQQKQKTYTYKTGNGESVTLDFPVFRKVNGRKVVTKDIFNGYLQYNSYCFRCHGPDAVGGEYAPDLRKSTTRGNVSWQEFLNTAMVGREAKGMPSWAGFFSEDQIRNIYEYVRARAANLVPPGRPPSPQD